MWRESEKWRSVVRFDGAAAGCRWFTRFFPVRPSVGAVCCPLLPSPLVTRIVHYRPAVPSLGISSHLSPYVASPPRYAIRHPSPRAT